MAYNYRNSQSLQDETPFSNFSTNPMSPPRNPHRLSGGMMSSSDGRASLTRRFTTNALPTLSPIGQQRLQAAGDPQVVRTTFPKHSSGGHAAADEKDGMDKHGVGVLVDLVAESEPSPGLLLGGHPGRARDGLQDMAARHRRVLSHGGPVGKGASGRISGRVPQGVTRLFEKRRTVQTYHSDRSEDHTEYQQHWLMQSDQAGGNYSRVQPSERRYRHIESLLEQQRRIAAELEQVDDETRHQVEQSLRHERAVTQMIAQSEPTTPPEYQDGFPTATSRPGRYSMNSLASPPSMSSTRTKRSSAQFTSPPSGFARPYTASATSTLPSQSVPGSRRHSDDEEEDDFVFSTYESGLHRAAANPNRKSMPVTSYDRKRNATDFSSALSPLNITSFLFDDDEQPSIGLKTSSTKTSPPDAKTYLQVQHTADGFPKLIRRDDNGELVAGSSAALDLALAQIPKSDQQVTDRATATRHRISLPPSALSSGGNMAPLNGILAAGKEGKSAVNNRRSMEVKFTAETKRPALLASPPQTTANGTNSILKTQSSYSTNDIPTLKSINGEVNGGGVSLTSPSTQSKILSQATSPEQITGTVNRATSNSTSNHRQSQDFTASQDHTDIYPSPQSGLQGGAAPFGAMHDQNQGQPFPSQAMSPYAQPPYYGGYGVHMLNNGFNSMTLGNGYGPPGQWPNNAPAYAQNGYNGQAQNGLAQYSLGSQVVPGAGRYSDNTRSNGHNRKTQADEFYNSASVSDIVGQIYTLCKDQHGCRYLQKKLEDRNEKDTQMIFDEVKEHFTELMMDPFGNYLCQRLLEYATDDQRTALVSNAAPEMTKIALNQHGTRALQRMIEYISTPEQTQLIINALESDVVQLIQDLNGNHVIQKCLNHLTPQDAQFIFDAVSSSAIVVGTHRHGCCVLQRCVDHATGLQKGALVASIINDAYALVQDPFGNYVVQYILDLSEPCFTEPLCQSFAGQVSYLSKQKFSSNVIEKCIRCSHGEGRRMIIQEIMSTQELERLLRDNYANYVVQTAFDSAEGDLKAIMVENMRPILANMRNTPHGRRLAGKITDWDAMQDSQENQPPGMLPAVSQSTSDFSSGPMLANHTMTNGGPFSSNGTRPGRGNRMGMIGAPPSWANNGFAHTAPPGGYGANDIHAPAPQRNHDYNFLNGGAAYPNQGFGGQNFRAPPNYGHF